MLTGLVLGFVIGLRIGLRGEQEPTPRRNDMSVPHG